MAGPPATGWYRLHCARVRGSSQLYFGPVLGFDLWLQSASNVRMLGAPSHSEGPTEMTQHRTHLAGIRRRFRRQRDRVRGFSGCHGFGRSRWFPCHHRPRRPGAGNAVHPAAPTAPGSNRFVPTPPAANPFAPPSSRRRTRGADRCRGATPPAPGAVAAADAADGHPRGHRDAARLLAVQGRQARGAKAAGTSRRSTSRCRCPRAGLRCPTPTCPTRSR